MLKGITAKERKSYEREILTYHNSDILKNRKKHVKDITRISCIQSLLSHYLMKNYYVKDKISYTLMKYIWEECTQKLTLKERGQIVAFLYSNISLKCNSFLMETFISFIYEINKYSKFQVNISTKIINHYLSCYPNRNIEYLIYLFNFMEGIMLDRELIYILNELCINKFGVIEIIPHLEIILSKVKIAYQFSMYEVHMNIIHWCLRYNLHSDQFIDIFLKFGFDIYDYNHSGFMMNYILFLFENNPWWCSSKKKNLDVFFDHVNISYKPLFLSIVQKDNFIIHDLWSNIIFQYLYGTKTEIQQIWDNRVVENLLATG